MAEDREKREEAERVCERLDAAAREGRRDRKDRPKTVTRAPADKMARPGLGRGYETK